MADPNTLKHHADLVDRMAQTVDVDLEDAVLSGAARFDDIADAVLKCTQCSNPGHCEDWLDRTRQADAPPTYCKNSALFARLKPGDDP